MVSANAKLVFQCYFLWGRSVLVIFCFIWYLTDYVDLMKVSLSCSAYSRLQLQQIGYPKFPK